MATKKWTHLKLKNGDQVQFIPPAPNGEQLGGITQDERESISKLEENIDNQQEQVDGLKGDMSALQNADKAAPAGNVWTATPNGAEWKTPTGGGSAEKEWALKGTLTTENSNGLAVDLNGCTEVILYGSISVTAQSYMYLNGSKFILSIVPAVKVLKAIISCDVSGINVYGRQVGSAGVEYLQSQLASYDWIDGTQVHDITSFKATNIESCNIKIYAR